LNLLFLLFAVLFLGGWLIQKQKVLDPVVVVRYVRVRSGGFSSKDFFLKIFKDFYVNLPLSSSFVCLFVFVFF